MHFQRLGLVVASLIVGATVLAQPHSAGDIDLVSEACGAQAMAATGSLVHPAGPRFDWYDTGVLPDTIVIPVVFHVFHQSRWENLRYEDLQRMLADCNRQINLHSVVYDRTPAPFRAVAAATRIELRLASVDPEGQCTDGVNRIESSLTDAYFHHYCVHADRYLNPLITGIHWPATQYLNIYLFQRMAVPDNNGAIAGRASFPPDTQAGGCFYRSAQDGIFLTAGNGLAFLDWDELSTTLSHELGHWLDVLHLWGTSCSAQADWCDDTPAQAEPSYACFDDFPKVTCNNGPVGNMFSNFMDYGDCKTFFTQGQVGRMHQALVRPRATRSSLWTLENLKATGTDRRHAAAPPCALPPRSSLQVRQNNGIFTLQRAEGYLSYRGFRDFFMCPGEPAQLDLQSNASRNTRRLRWECPGGLPAVATDERLRVTYTRPGTYRIRLIASNEWGVDTAETEFRVHAYGAPIATDVEEDFEAYTSMEDYGWTAANHGLPAWRVVDGIGYSGRRSLRLRNDIPVRPEWTQNDNFAYFLTPGYDLSRAPAASLRFRVAKPPISDKKAEVFLLRYKLGCYGEMKTFHTLLESDLHNDQLRVKEDSLYVPLAPQEWRWVEVPLPPEILRQPQPVHFVFTFINQEQKTVYIDDLSVATLPVSSRAPDLALAQLRIFPNPAAAALHVQWDATGWQPERLTLISAAGQRVYTHALPRPPAGGAQHVIPLATIPAGIYLLRLETAQGGVTRSVVVVK